MRGFAASLMILLLVTSAHALSPPYEYTTNSIELIAAESTAILRGTIVSVDPARPAFVLRVDETMSGDATAEYAYRFPRNFQVPGWITPGHQVMLLLSRGDRPGDPSYLPFDLESKFDPPFWTMFGQAITTRGQLLSALRKAIAETPPGRPRSASVRPLNDRMQAVFKSHDLTGLFYIPIDSRTETLANQMLASSREDAEWQGMYLLAQLPNEKNIERLRQYLTDPRLQIDEGPLLSPWTQSSYYYRKWAVNLLKQANAPVSGIHLTEPANIYAPIPAWMPLLVAVALVGLWLLMGFVPGLRNRSYRIAALSAILLLLVAGLWYRSRHFVDDFCYADGSRIYTLSIFKGRARIEIVHGFSPNMPPVHASFPPLRKWEDSRPWHELSLNPHTQTGEVTWVNRQKSPIASDTSTYAFWLTSQPLWKPGIVLSLGLFAPLLTFSLQAMQARRRKRQGLCPNCGYDLRATPARCPECGMEGTKAQS